MAIPPLVAGLAMASPHIIKAFRNYTTEAPQQKVSNDTTSYLNKLRQVSKEGLYGQNVKNDISSTIEASGDKREAKIMNKAVGQGIENSGVVGQQLLQSGDMTTLALARMAKKIAQMNEETKLDASATASNVGQSIEAIKYNNALAERARKDAVWDGIGNAISSGVGGYNSSANFQTNKDYENYLKRKAQFSDDEWDVILGE
ncbi:MAG: hypothetical protein Unbinned6224contig1001_33 [Prokaryotic dsDNA virus sp.]|nr:MAG: hypothetical protein Unbinned6224contig1001_33 [Prokaryotic dsDNA virus sp.]|tara:strand:- start:62 stop:667 length:606 start_codon:yes stop_codon:yes gene_type:complete